MTRNPNWGGARDNRSALACTTTGELLSNTVLGALNGDDDVIVFEGVYLADIYDGVRVRPVREVARFTVADLLKRPEVVGEEI